MIRINGMYEDADVGTGTYTRALVAALPEAEVWRSACVSSLRNRYPAKLLTEVGLARLHPSSRWIHPYAAASMHRHAVVSVLDLIHYRATDTLSRALIARSIKLAADIITISKATAELVVGEFGRSAHVVEPMPAPDFFSSPRVPPPRRDRLRLAYWGGWHPRKSILPTLSALQGLPVEIIVVGRNPATVELKGGTRVRTVSPLSTGSLIDLADSCDAVLYPSADEGYGLPVVEALLRDRPVIAQGLDVYKEFLKPNPTGLIVFDPEEPETLRRALYLSQQLTAGDAVESLRCHDLTAARTRMRNQLLDVPAISAEISRR